MSNDKILYPDEVAEKFYKRYELMMKYLENNDAEAYQKLYEEDGTIKPIIRVHHDAMVTSTLQDPTNMASFFVAALSFIKEKNETLGKSKDEAEMIEATFLTSLFTMLNGELAQVFKMLMEQYAGQKLNASDLFGNTNSDSYKEHLDDEPGQVDKNIFTGLDFDLPDLNKNGGKWH